MLQSGQYQQPLSEDHSTHLVDDCAVKQVKRVSGMAELTSSTQVNEMERDIKRRASSRRESRSGMELKEMEGKKENPGQQTEKGADADGGQGKVLIKRQAEEDH